MNTGADYTNSDCEKCVFSIYERTPETDYEEFWWRCQKLDELIGGHYPADGEKKKCGLIKGTWYEHEKEPTYKIVGKKEKKKKVDDFIL